MSIDTDKRTIPVELTREQANDLLFVLAGAKARTMGDVGAANREGNAELADAFWRVWEGYEEITIKIRNAFGDA